MKAPAAGFVSGLKNTLKLAEARQITGGKTAGATEVFHAFRGPKAPDKKGTP
jgi:hypothetical protein